MSEERLLLNGSRSWIGRNCETTALKRVLDYHGNNYSEEMLPCLGGGLG